MRLDKKSSTPMQGRTVNHAAAADIETLVQAISLPIVCFGV
jgi:hypothetical protein